ncbi:MAG: hypothetical protein AMK75_07150 [Planctomycetes bacterium SM23_65]|nr:MAG: hypothetical protein AMK75_07150 [Planctomycetes bacterium SM23_65]
MKTAAPVKRGFTLIELLVVMGIIGLLVGLLVPVVNLAHLVAQGLATKNTINRLEQGLTAFRADFGCYPPSDNTHESLQGRTAYGYKNLATALGGPDGVGWGWDGTPSDTDKKMPFGGTSNEKYGPYFEGAEGQTIPDSFRPPLPILYFRYEPSEDTPYDYNDNKATDPSKGEDGFVSPNNFLMLVQRRGTNQYVRSDYLLISAGPDRVFGYLWVDDSGNYHFPTTWDERAYCDDVANFKFEQY